MGQQCWLNMALVQTKLNHKPREEERLKSMEAMDSISVSSIRIYTYVYSYYIWMVRLSRQLMSKVIKFSGIRVCGFSLSLSATLIYICILSVRKWNKRSNQKVTVRADFFFVWHMQCFGTAHWIQLRLAKHHFKSNSNLYSYSAKTIISCNNLKCYNDYSVTNEHWNKKFCHILQLQK